MELKETLLMPKTDFEMRGNLTTKEPILVEKWQKEKLYEKMNANREGCNEFILHDGPPYANGDIHCGHMLNVLIKDFTVRYRNMAGYKTPYVFGWDTHGLPIENKVTKSGINRKAMSVSAFRDICKEYALEQVEHQKGQIKRMGCLGDYDNPYITLLPEYEARQIDVFATMALKGLIFKGVKPVYWSPSSESALAQAEVDYKDVTAKTMYVKFPLKDGKGVIPNDAYIVIWTTTPWTIPANQAVCFNPRFEYGVFETNKGKLVFLTSLKEKLKEELGLGDVTLLSSFRGQEAEGILVKHPLYERTSLGILANYVTEDSGTGIVHIAPDHGVDDFNACLKYGIKPFCPVDEKGYMHLEENDPCNGKFYEDANDIVIEELEKKGYLLKKEEIVHSYPHDWRTKKPVIFRATPQWFCSIEPIKEKLLEEIHKIRWEPAWGEEKMANMIKDRSDWCISRQRAWGVPLPIIYCEDGTPIIEKEVFDHIRELIAKEGSNVWFKLEAKELLPEGYTSSHSPNGVFTKETDIMDVWFDSGTSWNGTLVERGLKYPSDLYLEGNDQYRGWFNASLILSVATNDVAPFKTCITHGWVMDEKWQKMSKSSGNGVDPNKLANQYGADICRMWAASVDYHVDVKIGENVFAQVIDSYRKVRNTFKFMLGNLNEFDGSEVELSFMDKITLAKEEQVKNKALSAYDNYDFSGANNLLLNFLIELSSGYLDYAKDIMYCEKKDSPRRKAVQWTIYKMAKDICLLYNPILPFTMDEVYRFLPGNKKEFPQLEDMPKESKEFAKYLALYDEFGKVKDMVNVKLENIRNEGKIGSNLESEIVLNVDSPALYEELSKLDSYELPRLFLVSEATVLKGMNSVEAHKSPYEKCDRCRSYKKDTHESEHEHLCSRCEKVLG
ncbi:MAG: isoleucine--tRNA ligase [Bacilli bacterium]|nr:isoleucine--tRNA ligase [Bacilli bacterium]